MDPIPKKPPLLPTTRDIYSSEYSQTQPTPTISNKKQVTNLSATQPITAQTQNDRPAPKPAVKDTVRSFENMSANDSLNSSRFEHPREQSSSPEIQFSLETYNEKELRKTKFKPSKRETYKHITPNEDTDTDSNAEVEIEREDDEEDTLPDLQAPKDTSRRQLRSNSRT